MRERARSDGGCGGAVSSVPCCRGLGIGAGWVWFGITLPERAGRDGEVECRVFRVLVVGFFFFSSSGVGFGMVELSISVGEERWRVV